MPSSNRLHAYTNDEDTFDRGKRYVQGQDVIDSYVRAYNNDAEHQVRTTLLDSSDHIQAASAERDHIVLDPKKLAQAAHSLFSELPDVSFVRIQRFQGCMRTRNRRVQYDRAVEHSQPEGARLGKRDRNEK
jgi:hypothetical protein